MQAVLRIDAQPADALGAAAKFHARFAALAGEALLEADALVLVLPVAPYDHADWRRAAARDLARAHTPKRINLVAGGDEAAIDAAVHYLADASGVTGQYLEVDSHGVGNPAG